VSAAAITVFAASVNTFGPGAMMVSEPGRPELLPASVVATARRATLASVVTAGSV